MFVTSSACYLAACCFALSGKDLILLPGQGDEEEDEDAVDDLLTLEGARGEGMRG